MATFEPGDWVKYDGVIHKTYYLAQVIREDEFATNHIFVNARLRMDRGVDPLLPAGSPMRIPTRLLTKTQIKPEDLFKIKELQDKQKET